MKQEIRQITAGIRRKRLEHQLKKMLPDLYRSALSLCHNPTTAEDLVHDTCVKAIVACDKPNSEEITASRAWLKKILLNTFRDHYRRQQRWSKYVYEDTGDNVIELATGQHFSPQRQLASLDFATAAKQAMAEMSPKVRQVAVLFIVEGYSYQQIAELLDCPEGTVMSRLARARKKLREKLQDHVYRDEAHIQ